MNSNIKNIDGSIKNIKDSLINFPIDDLNSGLFAGKAGIMLFLFYYSRYYKDIESQNFAVNILENIIEEISSNNFYHTFCNGIPGIAWALQHLNANEFIEFDTYQNFHCFDDFLFESMIQEIKKKNYDYLHGSIGIALYFILFLKKKKNFENHLRNFVDTLNKIKVTDKSGYYWKYFNKTDDKKNPTVCDLGLAHGLPSIIIILCKLLEKGISKDLSYDLLSGSVKYLLSQKNSPNQFHSLFPSFTYKNNQSSNSRLAWCYGDVGIVISLWHAANVTNNISWKNEAIEILLHSTKRKDLKKNSINDACFCHGSAGLGHIYNRFYYHTKNKKFGDAANYWLNQTLKMAVHKGGLAGYKSFIGEGPIIDPTLLNGVAGIGLVLMSAIFDIKTNWDECLLIN